MPGKIIRILDKNTYSYTPAQLPASQSITFPVALNVDISEFPYQELVLRLHSASWGAGSSFTVTAFNSSVSEDDPSLLFRAALAFPVSSSFGDTVPFLKIASAVAGAAGSAFDILVTITQASSAQTLTFVASADLVLKS